MLRAIARWAKRRGLSAELVGVDLNPKSAAVARRPQRRPTFQIDYRTGDYREVGGGFDFVISNLVGHHMTDDQPRDFLRFMEAEARRGWIVNDLHRHRFAYFGYPLLCRLMGWHRSCGKTASCRSRACSGRPNGAILSRAGIDASAAKIVRRFPFRLCVERALIVGGGPAGCCRDHARRAPASPPS